MRMWLLLSLAATTPLSWAMAPQLAVPEEIPKSLVSRGDSAETHALQDATMLEWAQQNPMQVLAITAGTGYFFYALAAQGDLSEALSMPFASYTSKISSFFGHQAVHRLADLPQARLLSQGLQRFFFNLGASTMTSLFRDSEAPGSGRKPYKTPWHKVRGPEILTEAVSWTAAQIMAQSLGLAGAFDVWTSLFDGSKKAKI